MMKKTKGLIGMLVAALCALTGGCISFDFSGGQSTSIDSVASVSSENSILTSSSEEEESSTPAQSSEEGGNQTDRVEGNFPMSEGVEVKLNEETDTYSVVGIGTCTDNTLRLSGAYDGKRVTKIERDAFLGCTQLVSVEIDEGITQIGANAFLNCANLLQVTVGASVEKIDSYAFYNCYKLTQICDNSTLEITAGDKGNGHVGYYAQEIVDSESDLTAIEIAENDFVFQQTDETYLLRAYVGNEADITLDERYKENPYSIGDYCFARSAIESVRIPANFAQIGKNTFLSCASLQEIYYDGEMSAWGALQWENETSNPLSNGTKLFIAGELLAGNITVDFAIQPYAFYNYSYLTEITLGENCKTIGASAFEKCSGLTKVTTQGGLTEIADSAFQACSALETVNLAAPLQKIGEEAFYEAKKLKTITFPATLTEIGKKAFYRCEGLASLQLPAATQTVGVESFAYCMGLTELRLNDGLKNIRLGAFAYCSNLTEVIIPDSVINLEESAFRTCDKLAFVSIGQGVTKIFIRTFYQCPALDVIVLGSGVKQIENYAFVALYKGDKTRYCYYRGTEAEYTAIKNADQHLKNGFDGSSNGKANRTKLYYSETQPTENHASYWRYVDGKPVAWA